MRLFASSLSSGGSAPIEEGNYYLSASGSDSYSGKSPSTPWKTLAKLESEKTNLLAGDIVNFNGGDKFFGTLDLQGATNGTALEKITFQSYGTGKARITGAKELTGFINVGSNIWEADTNGDFAYHVIKDDSYSISAREPKWISDYSYNDNSANITDNPSTTSILVPEYIGLDDFTGATLFWQPRRWTWQQAVVTAFNTSTGLITFDREPAFDVRGPFHCIVTNHESFLGVQDEWFFDSVNGKLKIYSTTQPTGIEIVTIDDNGISHNGIEHYDFNNFEIYGYQKHGLFAESSYDTLSLNDVLIKQCSLYGAYQREGAGNIVKNSEVIECGLGGLNIENVDVFDNEFMQICLAKILSPYIIDVVNDRRVEFVCRVATSGNVYYNKLHEFGYNGIVPAWGAVQVYKNFVYDGMLDLDDGGLIYTYGLGVPTTGMAIYNNILLARQDWPDGASEDRHPIYMDNSTNDVYAHDNVCVYGVYNIFQNVPQGINTGPNILENNQMYRAMQLSFKATTISEAHLGNFIGNDILFDHNRIPIDLTITFLDGTMDYNNYFSLQTDVLIKYDDVNRNLADWRTFTGQEANSTDKGALNITADQVVYNTTKQTVVESLVGTWYDLDLNEYVGEITLEEFTGKILIQYT